MSKVLNLSSHTTRLRDRYPLVLKESITEKYKSVPVSYKSEEIEAFDVVLFHRLMKRNYGDPCEMQGQLKDEDAKYLGIRTVVVAREASGDGWKLSFPAAVDYDKSKEINNKKLSVIGVEWRYHLATESGGIIEIGTKDQHTGIYVGVLIQKEEEEPSARIKRECMKFINDMLVEAQRLKGELLNPKKEFEEGTGIRLYFLHNVYLSNYISAEFILDSCEELEHGFRGEFLRYDARKEYLNKAEMKAHTDKYMLAIGTYFAAAIAYYWMALEGFVNVIYHAFLRPEISDKRFRLEQRLDLEQKIRLMPFLCCGFKQKCIDPNSKSFEDFGRLKEYRNYLFHSKIEDSLKSVCIVESGFFYNVDFKRNSNQFISSIKLELNREDVLRVKGMVDNIITEILNSMESKYKSLMNKFVMKEAAIPFWKDEKGRIRLGQLKSGRFKV